MGFRNTIYILGAGASAEKGAPTMNNFMARILKAAADTDLASLKSTSAWKDSWALLAKQYPTIENTNIEDILTFLDILEANPSLYATTKDAVWQAKRFFADLIWFTITHTTPIEHDYQKCLQDDPHYTIASRLRPGDTVISFNYDLFIDRAMYDMCASWDLEYAPNLLVLKDGIEWVHSYGHEELHPPLGRYRLKITRGQQVKLLKLHGSLNWFFCPSCHQLDSERDTPATAMRLWLSHISKGLGCPNCNFPMRLFIVPPARSKSILKHDNIFNLNWDIARERLDSTPNVVFWGYSFSEIDVEAQELFRKSLKQKNKICIIDINPGVTVKYKQITDNICYHPNIYEYLNSTCANAHRI